MKAFKREECQTPNRAFCWRERNTIRKEDLGGKSARVGRMTHWRQFFPGFLLTITQENCCSAAYRILRGLMNKGEGGFVILLGRNMK